VALVAATGPSAHLARYRSTSESTLKTNSGGRLIETVALTAIMLDERIIL
jgi:hypothetical protein